METSSTASSQHSESTSNHTQYAQDLYTTRYPETRHSDRVANKPLPHSTTCSKSRTKHNRERKASGVCRPRVWTSLSHDEDASLLGTACSLKPQYYIGYTKSGMLGSDSQGESIAISPRGLCPQDQAPQIGLCPQYHDQKHEVRIPCEDDVCGPYSMSSSASNTTVTCFNKKTELEQLRTKIHHLEKEVCLCVCSIR